MGTTWDIIARSCVEDLRTDEGDNETETIQEEAHYLDHYFEDEENEKREAETSFNLKRAPNRKSCASVHSCTPDFFCFPPLIYVYS